MAEDTKPDLSFVAIADLLNELDRRCEAYIFAGIIKGRQREPNAIGASIWYSGNIYTAMGLAHQVEYDLTSRKLFAPGECETETDDSE